MRPDDFGFNRLNIYAFAFFVTLGLLTGILVAVREAKRLRFDHNQILDLCFYLLTAAVVGSRIFFVTTHSGIFIEDPREIYRIWNGGISVWGGFAGALIAALVFLKAHHLPFGRTADLAAPALAAGMFTIRLNRHFTGYGNPYSPDLVGRFYTFEIDPEAFAVFDRLFQPAALYYSLNDLVIFALIWYFRPLKKFDGQVFWFYVFLYGVSWFLIEMFRTTSGEMVESICTLSASAVVGSFALIMLAIVRNRAQR